MQTDYLLIRTLDLTFKALEQQEFSKSILDDLNDFEGDGPESEEVES